jgi:starch phosphorylase
MSSEKNPNVAYFCMEYGIDQRFKAYAGGLGILAGDYLKGAHDHQY